jgi:hypothetical protein
MPFEPQESTPGIPLENLPLPYFSREKTHLLRTKEMAAGKLPVDRMSFQFFIP